MYVQLFCLEGTSANLITSLCLLELELWYRVLSLYVHSGKYFLYCIWGFACLPGNILVTAKLVGLVMHS